MRLLDKLLNRGEKTAFSLSKGANPGSLEPILKAVPADAFYPAQDQGLPVVDPSALINANMPMIVRLKELTVSDSSSFEDSYLEPIRRLAHIVQLLPASSCEHYSAPAGLFKMCLDLGFYALQSADGKIFTPNQTIEERHKNEPRWRYATFLAALSSQVYRSLTMMSIVDKNGVEWPRFTLSLTDWLSSTGANRYFVKWHSASGITGGEGASVLNKIAPAKKMDWLASGDVQIVRDMHQVSMGASHQTDSIMATVILQVTKKLLEVDESIRRSRYGSLTCGMHIEPYLLDAIRVNIESGKWKVNSPGSPVWFGSDGLFIEWPVAHGQALEVLRDRNIHGVPGSALTYAELLGKAGVTIQAENGLWVREILIPTESGGARTKLATAMRFVDALAIFGHQEFSNAPYPFGAELVRAEIAAGSNLVPGQMTKKSVVPAAQPDVVNVGDAEITEPVLPSEKDAVPTQIIENLHHAQPPAQNRGDKFNKPESIQGNTDGEIEYAKLISSEAKRWIKSPDVAESVGQLIHLHKLHRGDVAKTMSYGVALSVEWLTSESASDIPQFVKIFETNRWLGRPPNVKNEAVKLHEIQFDDAVKKAIVLSTTGAKTIGFNLGDKK
jgi:conjugal transfer pilus assembly protein TraI